MSLADIEETINQLGNLSGRQGELRGLAEDVKEQQERLKRSVDAAVRLIALFRGSSQSMRAILERANAQKGEQEKYINELIAILNKEPSKDDVESSIRDLKLAAEGNSSQEEISALVREAGLSSEEVASTGIGQPNAPPQVPQAQQAPPAVGGFKWRTSRRRGKSSSKKSKRTKSKSTSKKITKTKSKRLTSRSKSRRRRSKGRSY